MEYTILRTNDNNTVTVEMKIGDRVLNQDIAIGLSSEELENNIKIAMAVFNSEIIANNQNEFPIVFNTPFIVSDLPEV